MSAQGGEMKKIMAVMYRGEWHLIFDAQQGRLSWEDNRPGRVKEQTGPVWLGRETKINRRYS